MSNKSDINSGLVQGVLQGAKTGLGFSRMESGIKKGTLNGISRREKVQDPAMLSSTKQPLTYWVADIFPEVADGTTVSSVPNLAGSATLTVGGNPARRKGCGNKSYIDFDNTSDLIQTSSTTGTRELTVMMVFRPSSAVATDTAIFERLNSAITQTGDISIYITGSNKIAVRFNSSTSTTSYLRYETSILRDYSLSSAVKTGTAENEWILLVAKFDMNRGVSIPGRDIEVYINGTKNNMALINDTWNLATGQNMPSVSCFFGNSGSAINPSSSGVHVAAGIVFDYWLSNAEQLRIENFLKHYYGFRF